MRTFALAVAGALAVVHHAAALEQFVGAVQKVQPSVATVVSTSNNSVSSVTTGIVVSPDGFVLTACPQPAFSTLFVRIGDKSFPGTVHGSDALNGLALIKIDADNLVPAEFADSSELQVGQWVMSVGNQFGIERNAAPGFSVGIIGGLDCCVPLCETHNRHLIKTDAPMNPGCVGGPLVDLTGRVVGINIAIWSSTGDWQGVGYAIPSNAVAQSLQEMKTGKKIERGWLGVTIAPADTVRVSGVGKNTPAEKAGLHEGDRIVSWNERELADALALVDAVAATEPGSRADIVIERDSKQITVSVEVGARPEPPAEQRTLSSGGKPAADACELPEALRTELSDAAAKFQQALQHSIAQIKDPTLLDRYLKALENLPGVELRVLSSSSIEELTQQNLKLKKELEELKKQLQEKLKE